MVTIKAVLKKTRRKDGVIIHSDQVPKEIKEQTRHKYGNCFDNASMENFFGHVKSELFYN
jgi:transposase InsO family protein